MNKLTKDDIKELIAMKELTVREFFEKIKQHPTLSGLLTTAGVWFVTITLLLIMILGNAIYIVTRIFNMVIS